MCTWPVDRNLRATSVRSEPHGALSTKDGARGASKHSGYLGHTAVSSEGDRGRL